MLGETMNQAPLVRSLGSEDADRTKEVNWGNKYFKMLNKYGREVHINIELESDKLRRGFIHTDRKIYSDDMSTRVVAPAPVTPMDVMAKLATQMVETNKVNTEALQAVAEGSKIISTTAPKKTWSRRKKVVATAENEQLEASNA